MIKKAIYTIIAVIAMLQMVSCDGSQSKQLEGIWETTVPYYENNVSGDIVYHFTFKRKTFSGGNFELIFGGQISIAKFAVKVEGDWEISLGKLYLKPDLRTLETEKDIFLAEVDLEGMMRSELYNFGEGGATIVQLDETTLKLGEADGSTISFSRLYEISTANAYTGDDFERLWIAASERELTQSDISGLSKQDRRILRNYFYARFNLRFKSQDLADFFSQYSWYKPLYDDAKLVEPALTDIQKRNIKFLKDNE
jgi:hypothetical protein